MSTAYSFTFFISAALTLAAIVAFAAFGLNLGVDFRGGSLMELEFKNGRPDFEEVKKAVGDSLPNIKGISFTDIGENGIVLKAGQLSEQDHQDIIGIFNSSFLSHDPSEKKFDSVGPVIGRELKQKSITDDSIGN